jgi:hypothetical protein
MKKETRHTVRAGVKIGALAGGVAVMSAIAGGPIAPGLLARATIVIGTVLGICAAGAVSVCAGAAAGSALGYVADALTPAKEAEEVKS